MNIEVIKVGMEFKNYTILCKTIGIEVAKGGRNLKLQKEELKRFFNWQVEGRKITITEIYPKPKEKIDNRGKSEGSRNNNSVYMLHIDRILTDYFNNMDINVTYATINQLAEKAGITNINYIKFKDNQEVFLEHLKENKIIENSTALNNVFYSIQDILRPMISSSLNRLKNQGIIECEYDYILQKKSEVRLVTDEEKKIIEKCEKRILTELGIKKVDIGSSDILRKEYYNKVNKLVFEEIKDIDLYYMGYKITIKTQSELKLENIQQHKEDLNSIVKERVRDRNVRRKKKTEDKDKEIVFGSQVFRDYEEDMLKESYLMDTEVIIDYLLDPNIEKVDITKKKDVNKKTVENSLSVEKVISNEEDINDNITETKVGASSLINESELPIRENEINNETEWAFEVSHEDDINIVIQKNEYKPKYQWQREDFIGYEDGEEEEIPF
ncbi:hypothetical protein ACR77J_04655 [Tissierella praeacuta]|uniref:hypothetical protein n=1 Tax=Tissierella praeacuta TaxID=43131 RepID=UPI003DA2395F